MSFFYLFHIFIMNAAQISQFHFDLLAAFHHDAA
jgi:hypothetical protein